VEEGWHIGFPLFSQKVSGTRIFLTFWSDNRFVGFVDWTLWRTWMTLMDRMKAAGYTPREIDVLSSVPELGGDREVPSLEPWAPLEDESHDL
jgi:hypothetical protein